MSSKRRPCEDLFFLRFPPRAFWYQGNGLSANSGASSPCPFPLLPLHWRGRCRLQPSRGSQQAKRAARSNQFFWPSAHRAAALPAALPNPGTSGEKRKLPSLRGIQPAISKSCCSPLSPWDGPPGFCERAVRILCPRPPNGATASLW